MTPREPACSQTTPHAPQLSAAPRGFAELTPLHHCCLLSTACASVLHGLHALSSFLQGQFSAAQPSAKLPPLGASLISKQKATCWPDAPGRAELGSGSSLWLEQFNISSRSGWGIHFGCCHPFRPHLQVRAQCHAQQCAGSLLTLLSQLPEFPRPAFISP